MPAQKVTLIFPSLRHLWEFAQAIQVNSIEIIAKTSTLICDCKDADVQLAKEKYGAVVRENSGVSRN